VVGLGVVPCADDDCGLRAPDGGPGGGRAGGGKPVLVPSVGDVAVEGGPLGGLSIVVTLICNFWPCGSFVVVVSLRDAMLKDRCC
jgi:hypothetical protein